MTAEEAITELESLIGVYDDIYDYEAKELWPAFELAVAALREKAEREDPQPLTIGELRQMNGEPVWVEELSELRGQTGWAIVVVDNSGIYKDVPFVKAPICTWNAVCRKLHCYRHKPKEVA